MIKPHWHREKRRSGTSPRKKRKGRLLGFAAGAAALLAGFAGGMEVDHAWRQNETKQVIAALHRTHLADEAAQDERIGKIANALQTATPRHDCADRINRYLGAPAGISIQAVADTVQATPLQRIVTYEIRFRGNSRSEMMTCIIHTMSGQIILYRTSISTPVLPR